MPVSPIVTTSDTSSSSIPTLSELKIEAKNLDYCLNHLKIYLKKSGKKQCVEGLKSAKKDATILSKHLKSYLKIASRLPSDDLEVVNKDNLLKSEFLRQIHTETAKIKSLLA